jgi:Holliday junction resolvase RusA-like endonuclease
MNELVIVVPGTPVTQGSKTRNRYGMHDDNAKVLKPWRKKVKDHATDASRYHEQFTGPVRVTIRFCFDRPASHYRTGRNAALLKDGSPLYPTYKNDVDKLQRACFDALTDAEVWTDDGLAVDVRARKFYAGESEYALDHAGVLIHIEPLDTSSAAGPPAAVGEAPAEVLA